MEPPQTQSGPDATAAYFDPDSPDMSEQQFAASLERPDRSTFVVDNTEDPVTEKGDHPAAEVKAKDQASPSAGAENSMSNGLDVRHSTTEADWRNQVSAKISHYKSRKAPKVRYPSLQLPFEPPAPRERRTREPEAEFHEENPAQIEIPQSRQTTQGFVSLDATARVIEFPRPAAPPHYEDELAEPVLDRPRIVEAPALLPPPPALGGILIEQTQEQAPERRAGFDMPLQTAALRRRALAAAVDGIIVSAASALFAYVFFRFNGPISQPKLAVQLATPVMAILWAGYQYAFLVHSGSTPGLLLCRLALTQFDGAPVPRRARRWRVLASLLSCISLGLGYAWCFFDEDQLSWHDRITKTHLCTLNSGSRS